MYVYIIYIYIYYLEYNICWKTPPRSALISEVSISGAQPFTCIMEIRFLTKSDISFCGLGFEIEKTNYLCAGRFNAADRHTPIFICTRAVLQFQQPTFQQLTRPQ